MVIKERGELIFDECTDATYIPVFENAGYRVQHAAKKRKVKGRFSFTDIEVLKITGRKHPVVTKDAKISKSTRYQDLTAGIIILKQPKKGVDEIAYKEKIKNYIEETEEKDFYKKIVEIPLEKDIIEDTLQ